MKTPLEPWIAGKIGWDGRAGFVESLHAYQLDRLNRTIALAQERSRFFRRTLGTEKIVLSSLEGLADLPFSTAEDVREAPHDFLCVRQDEVSRIVTLPTSGTTGSPKRIFFSEDDQELTRDFFHVGMSTLVVPGDRVLILLPGALPGGVGSLLREGLARMEVEGVVYGPVTDPLHALDTMERERITALVGIPVQVLRLARVSAHLGRERAVAPRAVLLSTDYVPRAVVEALEDTWGCSVYNHYGTTEMGLGGGVDCVARAAYHLREADLFFEIVDPASGRPAAEGKPGEVVFSTLTRRAMPLVRYRTGDISRFLPGDCPCGTVLRRLAHVEERLGSAMVLSEGTSLRQRDFDEVLLPLPGVVDFRVEVSEQSEPRRVTLVLAGVDGSWRPEPGLVSAALTGLPSLAADIFRGSVILDVGLWDDADPVNTGTGKRRILGIGGDASR